MVQRRCSFSFAAKPLQRKVIVREVIGEEFESYEAVETNVLGFVDNAHASAAEFLEDAIVRDRLARKRLGVRHATPSYGGTRNESTTAQLRESKGRFQVVIRGRKLFSGRWRIRKQKGRGILRRGGRRSWRQERRNRLRSGEELRGFRRW